MAKKEGRGKRRLGLAMKILLWAGATAVPLVAFALASAHVARAGGPVWLAATCGALAFPAGPLAWHGIAAWRRRRARRAQESEGQAGKQAGKKDAPQKEAVLGPRDRLLLRIFAVGALVLGVGFGGFWDASWSALRDHGAWFWPEDDAPEGEAELLSLVPPDARAVTLSRLGAKESGGALDPLARSVHFLGGSPLPPAVRPAPSEGRFALFALGGEALEEQLVVFRGDAGAMLESAKSAGWERAPLGETRGYRDPESRWRAAKAAGGAVVFVTAGWTEAALSGRDRALPEPLAAALARAPADAPLVGLGASFPPDADPPRKNTAVWLPRTGGTRYRAVATFQMEDAPAAETVRDDLRGWVETFRERARERDIDADDLLDAVQVRSEGDLVTATLDAEMKAILGLVTKHPELLGSWTSAARPPAP